MPKETKCQGCGAKRAYYDGGLGQKVFDCGTADTQGHIKESDLCKKLQQLRADKAILEDVIDRVVEENERLKELFEMKGLSKDSVEEILACLEIIYKQDTRKMVYTLKYINSLKDQLKSIRTKTIDEALEVVAEFTVKCSPVNILDVYNSIQAMKNNEKD